MTTYWLFVFNAFFWYQRTCCLLLRLILVFLVKRSKGLQSLLHAGPSLLKHLTVFVTKAIPQSLTVQDVQQASMRKIPTCDIDKEEKCSGKAPHRDQPSPCHQPQPLTPAPKLSQLSQAPADSRWVRIPRAPPGPEVRLVLLGVADYRGGAARKASAVAWWWWWTHSPPPAAWGKVAAGKHCTLLFPKASIPSSAGVQECLLNIDTSEVQVLLEVNVLHIQQGRKLPSYKGTGVNLILLLLPM